MCVGGGDRCHGDEAAPAAGEPSKKPLGSLLPSCGGKPLPPRVSAPASPTAAHGAPSPVGESTNPQPPIKFKRPDSLLSRGGLPHFLPLAEARAAQSGASGAETATWRRPMSLGVADAPAPLGCKEEVSAPPPRSMQTQVPGTGR